MSRHVESSDSKPQATLTLDSPVDSVVVICEATRDQATEGLRRAIDLAGRVGMPPEKVRIESSLDGLRESDHPDLAILVDRPASELLRARDLALAVWRLSASPRPRERMLVGVDSGKHSPRKGVDRQALAMAERLAENLGLELHAVTAWKPPRLRSYQLEAEVRASVSVFRRLALRRARKDARLLEIPPDRWHVREGPHEAAVSEVANELDPYVVVLGTLRRQGLARLALGSRVEKVLQTVPDCHVLAVG